MNYKIPKLLLILFMIFSSLYAYSQYTISNDFPLEKAVKKFDKYGRSMDSNQVYLPLNLFKYSKFSLEELEKKKNVKKISNKEYKNQIDGLTRLDRDIVRKVSRTLYRYKEPILSAKYWGYESYRVLIELSGPAPISLRFILKDNKPEIIIKKGVYEDRFYPPFLSSTESKIISVSEWDTLNTLANKVNYLSGIESITNDFSLDGFSWTLEISKSDGYRVVRRDNINDESRKISLIMLYMLKCAGIEHMFGEGTNFKPAELFNKIVKEEGITFN